MAIHPLAGKPAPKEVLANIPRLVSAFYTHPPDPTVAGQRVVFGTSGHRGSSLKNSFNQDHIIAISQAICEYRASSGITGPLFTGMDTHALSEPALATALEVFAAAGVTVMIQKGLGYTPTPVISHAILTFNRERQSGLADGVVITPSHNPPEDGGFKYNPPHGGPAGTEITRQIADRANAILEAGCGGIKRMPVEKALKAETTHTYDYITPYVIDLSRVVDMPAIAASGLKLGVDPMGGAAVDYWTPIAERYGLAIEVVNPVVDPTFGFMPLDKDGKIRMDCSSPYAMQRLIGLKERFDVAFGNDTDVDRHGIVTRSTGLLNPNHFLAVAIWYLFQNRPDWPGTAAIGKTLVSTSMIDRVAAHLGKKLSEVPVGFKWFVDGLMDGKYGFGGEESAGASFLRMDGSVWTTDKDGIIMDLLAAEIMAKTERDPGEIYRSLETQFGASVYARIDAPATAAQKAVLEKLSAETITRTEMAGEPIVAKHTRAPGNQAEIGGLKVVTENGWFAARPSGTEEIYKIYAESFKGQAHLEAIQQEAQAMVGAVFTAAGV
ncbi:phosphoglucomutase (alpha-D-glucose-1,6-bisphosphate-dependent) [Desulfosarcina ovata]|uniref:Phosphoglucomutase, alpha-D-glucose phosphate-specific n=1 Tax=Desulfosarcina ovata subsp. ovata TaxID=2752305 RepID=A0A5K8A8S2_9BACT|nr:phosphoglucomutase (alpha-D-glucose-1,6-bisphosphate-dependent) [Desulfosarcina ovata]BBO88935.1 phosphoglucomutase, alpha-D-glucose phosphate-specific [Desulfosarcina ovata subsp. ovata]